MFIIYKHQNWLDQPTILDLDPERVIKFNAGEKIQVTEEELKQIDNHRWLIVENYNGE